MAALSTAYFLVKCKGALYPINYDNNLNNHNVKTLSEMCCDVIARDSGFAKKVIHLLPTQIYYLIMKRAINQNYHRTVSALIPTWPFRLLCVKEMWPELPSSINLIYDNNLRQEFIKSAVTLTTTLINSFVNIVKSERSHQGVLRILDLRGFPTIDRTLKNLAVELLTVQLEDTSDKYHIYIDCNVRDEDTCNDLLSAIFVNKNCRLQLHISKIDLSCLKENELQSLIQNLNPKELIGLSLQFNSLENEGLFKLQPHITDFKSLKSLDISCNNLQFSTNSFSTLFGQLPNLHRLDLSNNRICGRLSSILPVNVLEGIEYLKLSACYLVESDLIYLTDPCLYFNQTLQFNPKLCELDLSENTAVGYYVYYLDKIMTTYADHLRVLEIEDCKFRLSSLNGMVKALQRMEKLKYVNLARHKFDSESLCNYVSLLSLMPDLKCVRVSYGIDCYVTSEDENVYDERKQILRDRMVERIKFVCHDARMRVVWTELI